MKKKAKAAQKASEQNNLVAKHNFNRGGFHTETKYVRRVKHKGMPTE